MKTYSLSLLSVMLLACGGKGSVSSYEDGDVYIYSIPERYTLEVEFSYEGDVYDYKDIPPKTLFKLTEQSGPIKGGTELNIKVNTNCPGCYDHYEYIKLLVDGTQTILIKRVNYEDMKNPVEEKIIRGIYSPR